MNETIKLLTLYALPLIVLALSVRSHIHAKRFAKEVQKRAEAFNEMLLADGVDPSSLEASFDNPKK